MKPSFPPRPECITSPGTMSGFHPRRMPELRIACPASENTAQRYREPLWRPFKGLRQAGRLGARL